MEQTLEAWMELKVNREKTRTVRLNEPGAALNFLGYTFRYDRDRYGMNRRYLNLTPSEKSLQQTRGKLREMTDAGKCFMPIRRMIDQINQTLRGWKAYFRQGYPAHAYREVDGYTLRRLRNHLGRRSQRAYKKPEGVTWWDHLQGLGWKPLQTKPVRA